MLYVPHLSFHHPLAPLVPGIMRCTSPLASGATRRPRTRPTKEKGFHDLYRQKSATSPSVVQPTAFFFDEAPHIQRARERHRKYSRYRTKLACKRARLGLISDITARGEVCLFLFKFRQTQKTLKSPGRRLTRGPDHPPGSAPAIPPAGPALAARPRTGAPHRDRAIGGPVPKRSRSTRIRRTRLVVAAHCTLARTYTALSYPKTQGPFLWYIFCPNGP